MTSKNLFFKLIKQDFKKRIWCPILIFIAYFLALEVVLLMQLEAISQNPRSTAYNATEYVTNIFLGSNDVFYTLCVCLTALICGISGFSYLNSKMQLDTYHSMPVSRGVLFFSKYVSGILQFIVPFVIHIIICLIIAASQNAFTTKALTNAMIFIGVELLFFALAYGSTLLAVCLTGNIIVNILGAITVFCYSYIISILAEIMFAKFFDTYIWHGDTDNLMFWAFSPLAMICKYNNLNGTYFNQATAGGIGYLVTIFIGIVIYTVLSYILYKNRPSEAAGKAIAFEWAKPVLKTLLVIPMALFTGLFFNEISSRYNALSWFLFGVVFGYIIISLLIEVIFEMDIRSAFKHKKQFVFNAVCVSFIVIIFHYDALGFDTYVPKDSQIESCAVSINGLFEVSERVKYEYGGYRYISSEDYIRENMHLKDNPSVTELARKLAAEGLKYEDIEYYDGVEETDEYKALMEKQDGYRSLVFTYNLSNGKRVCRRYNADINDEQTIKLLADVFNDTNYKLGSNPLFNNGWREEHKGINCTGHFEEKSIPLNKEKMSKLMETYQSEYMQLTFDTVMNTIPVGKIGFMDEVDEYTYHYSTYVVYPEFTKTIELVKKYGFDFNKQPISDDIYNIKIENYVEHDIEDTFYAHEVEFTEFKDKEQIKELISSIVNEDIINCSYSFTKKLYDHGEYHNIHVEKSNGEVYYCCFKKDSIPDFVIESVQK